MAPSTLPPEILLDVASHLLPLNHRGTLRHLTSLALASRTLNAVAELHLYHTVHVHSSPKLTSFLLSLLARPSRAHLLRALSLSWSDGRTPLSHTGSDAVLRSALAGAFLADLGLPLTLPQSPRRRTPLVRPDPADDRLVAASVHHNLHQDLRRALAEDSTLPQIVLLLRLLPPSLPQLTLVGPPSDSWLADSLLFPHVVSAGPRGCFSSLRTLSVDFHHSPHTSHILACLLLPNLDSLELACASDGPGDAWTSSGVSAALRSRRGTSSVTKLFLPSGALSGSALADILAVPYNLQEFGYHRAGAWVVWTAQDWAALSRALVEQPTLETFDLVEQYTSAEDEPGTLGSALAGLERLKRVHVPWRALVRPADPIDPIGEEGPTGLAAVLPTALEHLVLRNDAGRSVTHRARRLLDVLPHRRSLSALHFDAAAGEEQPGDEAELKRECGRRGVEVGTQGVSSWGWAFRPASEVVRLDSRSYYC